MSNANKQEYFGNICLRTIILPLVEEISDLTIIAFGPTGDAVMIHQKSPREIKITKSGLEIINTFKGARHPVIDMIIDIMQSYAKENGADGTKRIILLLKFFLRSLLNDNPSSTWTSDGESSTAWRCKMIRQISKLIRHWQGNPFTSLDTVDKTKDTIHFNKIDNIVSVSTESSRNSPHLPACKIMKSAIVDAIELTAHSFFKTRFPPKVSGVLEDVTLSYLKSVIHHKGKDKSIQTILNTAKDNFFNNCIEIKDQPVQCSKVVDGFLLSDCLSPHNSITLKKSRTRFLVWTTTKNDDSEENEIFYQETQEGKSLIEGTSLQYQRLISKLSNDPLNVDLVICNFGLPEFARHHCRSANVSVIEYADLEELNFLAEKANILPLAGSFDQVFNDLNEDMFTKYHVGQTLSGFAIHEVRFGQHFFTKIPLDNCDRIHPLICGLTQQQVKQYSSAVFNCIKLVVNSSYVNPDISNNDQDERQSSKKSSYEKIAISLVPISKQYGATQTDSPFPYFEQTLILWIEKQKSVLIGMEEVTQALCTALEAIIGVQINGNRDVMIDLIQISNQKHVQSSDIWLDNKDCYKYYPVKHLIAQVNCVLHIAQSILRIERVCSTSKRLNKRK